MTERSTVYHVGQLDRDRRGDPALHKLPNKLWRASERDEVFLFQKRVGFQAFAYHYQKRIWKPRR